MAHSLYLVAFLCLLTSTASASFRYGQKFPREGPAGDSSMLPQWEISYYAKDYKPICGVSYETEGDTYWSNSPECEPAMVEFQSSDDSVQVYDKDGAVTDSEFGGGSELCLCFAVQFLPNPGRGLDICLAVGSAGDVMIRDEVGVGIQSPQANTAKLLPPCGPTQTATQTPTPTARVPSTGQVPFGAIPKNEANNRLATWQLGMGVAALLVVL